MLGLTSLMLPHLARPKHCYSRSVRDAVEDLVADYWDQQHNGELPLSRQSLMFAMSRVSDCPLCRATLMRSIIDYAVNLACLRADLSEKPWLLGTAFKDRWP